MNGGGSSNLTCERHVWEGKSGVVGKREEQREREEGACREHLRQREEREREKESEEGEERSSDSQIVYIRAII